MPLGPPQTMRRWSQLVSWVEIVIREAHAGHTFFRSATAARPDIPPAFIPLPMLGVYVGVRMDMSLKGTTNSDNKPHYIFDKTL
ncbi:hypothetical protein L227DRAFT_230456 [Lentinus tigrinus ALCF2SS1-6]|uniref:Uncharacterized protein n=1 Tax=Lentinus tigrinus ALCF2SS1-6 TaxID=1328759 RepID=A0A5C2S1Z3_9APHY|nr:hypothetical protein L227DRAFT_230456 [Lentinus tigrinus ALCF2SS1-6]